MKLVRAFGQIDIGGYALCAYIVPFLLEAFELVCILNALRIGIIERRIFYRKSILIAIECKLRCFVYHFAER